MVDKANKIVYNYRFMTAYLLLRVNFDKNVPRALRFWCVKCTNLKGECIGQASKLNRKCIVCTILEHKVKMQLVHTRHKQTFCLSCVLYVIDKTFQYYWQNTITLVANESTLRLQKKKKKKATGFCSFYKHFLEKPIFE